MKILKEIQQDDVWEHWRKVEKHSEDNFRSDIRNPLQNHLRWYASLLEASDIGRIYIISSDDWRYDRLCIQDFKLLTAISNYQTPLLRTDKYHNIREKEMIFRKDFNGIDTKLFFVAPHIDGPFTIIEGNHRAVALGNIGKLCDLEIYLGISPIIINYHWSRYSR